MASISGRNLVDSALRVEGISFEECVGLADEVHVDPFPEFR